MTLIKVLHMSFGVLAILMFATRAILGFRASPNGQLQSAGMTKFFKIAPHVVYTVVIVCGVLLLLPLPIYPHWIIAKIVLFFVAISASVKAFKPEVTAPQFRTGVFVATIAYVAILFLAIAKPGGFI
ncbi:MAG: SirB2 family protein [Pseudomonadota bacterium]|nr:SirB2 family protein [Pseudomonadota bacterium]